MNRYVKLLVLSVIVSVLFVQSGIYKNVLGVNTAYAVGDLTVNWGVPEGDPIFTLNGMAPGQSETHSVSVKNSSSTVRLIGVSAKEVEDTGNLADVLLITISQNGTDIYGGTTGIKTLSQFFSESTLPNFVPLTQLTAGATTNYVFTVTFSENAGNEYQNKTVKMDLIIGLTLDIPLACESINFTGNVINGTQNNDSLRGTTGNDLIIALEGNDSVLGGAGNDCIITGPGVDSISSDNGDDIIDSGLGNDQIVSGNGNDKVLAGDGNDRIDLGNGDDQAQGGNGADTVNGANGNDVLHGEGGSDTAVGGNGSDTCVAEIKVTCEL